MFESLIFIVSLVAAGIALFRIVKVHALDGKTLSADLRI